MGTNKIYPRVLVINGEPFNYESAHGITTSNLFEGWPKDRVAQIYSAKIQPDLSICNNNWQFNNTDLCLFYGFKKFWKQIWSHDNYNNNLVVQGINTSIKSKQSLLRIWLTPWADLIPYNFSDEFLHWLNEFKPELIYSTLGNIRMVGTVQRIARHLSIPIVPHFMDDWLTTYSGSGKSFLTTLQRLIVRYMTGRLLRSVHLGVAGSDAMASEYSQIYQRRFDAFITPVEITSDCTVTLGEAKETSSIVRFVYVGGMHLSRYENLKDIGNVICELRNEGHNIEFCVYAPRRDIEQYGPYLTLENCVQVCGTLSQNDVQKTLRKYDVAVHVESFYKKRVLYTRLSMSTKIPQYFAAGLPVLAYGPADVASCRYVSDYECGKVVGKQDSKALAKAIHELASSRELRFRLGRNSWNVAKERHDIHKEQERFRKILLEAAVRCAS